MKKKLLHFLNLAIKFLVLLGAVFVVYIFSDSIFKYIIHGKSFYLVSLGDKEYQKRKYAEAIEHYNTALRLYPKHVKARYNLANIYANYEDYESAVREYRKTLEYDPTFLNAGINLGILLSEELRDYDAAIETYTSVVNARTRLINIPFIFDNRKQVVKAKSIAYYNMGLAYRDKAMLYSDDRMNYSIMLQKSIDCYAKSLALDPKNYDAQYNLALAKHLLGLYTEALTGYCKAILISPFDYEAHYNLAVLLKEKNMYEDAYEEFKQAGMLMDYIGDTDKSVYIYTMLSDVSRMAIAEYGYEPREVLEKLDDMIDFDEITDQEGFVSVHDLEEAMRKYIKTKSICRKFLIEYNE